MLDFAPEKTERFSEINVILSSDMILICEWFKRCSGRPIKAIPEVRRE